MGGGRRFFMRADQRDPEHGSNAHYGRQDGRDLIDVNKSMHLASSLSMLSSSSSLST